MTLQPVIYDPQRKALELRQNIIGSMSAEELEAYAALAEKGLATIPLFEGRVTPEDEPAEEPGADAPNDEAD